MTAEACATRREALICDNLGLVHTCAHRLQGKGMEYDDLVQAGSIGLIKAVDGFDESRGLCFSTYAVPLILGEMRRLFREGGTVKVSRTLKERSIRAARWREAYTRDHGREPTVSELAEALDIEPGEAVLALGASQPPLSLTPESEEDDRPQLDLQVPFPEDRVVNHLALEQVLSRLEPKDRAILRLRYGGRQTQQATADRLGMTQVQVSRREKAILATLRRKLG